MRGFAFALCLLVGCADASPPSRLPEGMVESMVYVQPGADVGNAIARVEVRLDGELRGSSENGWIEIPPLDLAVGDHRLDLRVLLRAPADESGRGVVWSMVERFTVRGPTKDVPTPAVRVELVLRPGSSAVARRFEARFKGEGVAFLDGSLPRLDSVASVEGQAQSLSREGETVADPIADADQRIGRMTAAVDLVTLNLESARNAKDIVLINCLNDKLTQLRTARDAASERREALLLALNQGDSSGVLHQHTIVVTLSRRVDAVAVEARDCLGYTFRGGAD